MYVNTKRGGSLTVTPSGVNLNASLQFYDLVFYEKMEKIWKCCLHPNAPYPRQHLADYTLHSAGLNSDRKRGNSCSTNSHLICEMVFKRNNSYDTTEINIL